MPMPFGFAVTVTSCAICPRPPSSSVTPNVTRYVPGRSGVNWKSAFDPPRTGAPNASVTALQAYRNVSAVPASVAVPWKLTGWPTMPVLGGATNFASGSTFVTSIFTTSAVDCPRAFVARSATKYCPLSVGVKSMAVSTTFASTATPFRVTVQV